MIIPKQLKIGAQKIKVTLKPLVEIDPECNGGWARWEQNELIIASDVPEDRQAVIFLHEILHFINVYLEEEEVTYLSESLLQVLRENNLYFSNDELSTL